MCLVVLERAPRGKECQVEAAIATEIGECEGPDDVGPNGLDAVVFAPIHVRPARQTRRAYDAIRRVLVELALDVFAILHSGGGEDDVVAALAQEPGGPVANPASAAVDEELH